MNRELLEGSHLFTAFPYIPPNPLLPPIWSICTVIPLLLHPHAHLLSVSLNHNVVPCPSSCLSLPAFVSRIGVAQILPALQ